MADQSGRHRHRRTVAPIRSPRPRRKEADQAKSESAGVTWAGFFKQPALWIVAAIGAGLGSVLTAFVSGLVGPILDPEAFRDSLNSKPAITVVSIRQSSDYGWAFDGFVSDSQIARFDDVYFGMDTATEYMLSLGGWPRGYNGISLVLKSERAKPIRILAMTPKIVRCQAVPTGTLVLTNPEGEDPTPHLGVNIDSPAPEFIDTSKPKGTSRSYFANHTLVLAPEDVLPIYIDSYAFQKACEWRISVDALVDGEKESFDLDTGKDPFRVAAGSPDYEKAYAMRFQYGHAVGEGKTQIGAADKAILCNPDCEFPVDPTPY